MSGGRAQSEAVGVTLLVGVVLVATASAGAVYVGSIGEDADHPRASVTVEVAVDRIVFANQGGASLSKSDLRVVVRVDGSETSRTIDDFDLVPDDDATFDRGDRLRSNASLSPDRTVSVRLYHVPSNQRIAAAETSPDPTPAPASTPIDAGGDGDDETETDTPTPTPTPGDDPPTIAVDDVDGSAADDTVTLSDVSATDPNDDLDSLTIDVYDDDGDQIGSRTIDLSGGSYDDDAVTVGANVDFDGEYDIVATAADSRGNDGAASGEFETEESEAPEIDDLDDISADPAEDQVTVDELAVDDENGDLSSVVVEVKNDDGDVLASQTFDADGETFERTDLTFDVGLEYDSDYSVVATATDADGNEGSESEDAETEEEDDDD